MPNPHLLDAAAQEIVAREQARLPNLAAVTVVLPNLHAAPGLEAALSRAARQPTLLLPRIVTLQSWAAGAAVDVETLPDSRRGAMLYQALRERGWFAQADLWGVAQELLRLFDELTAHSIALPSSFDDFATQLRAAYQARAGASLHFEARLVHELWYAMSGDQPGRTDPLTHYHLRLSELARSAAGPVYGIGLSDLTPAEAGFFAACAERQPTHLFQHTGATSDAVADFLETAWPREAPHSALSTQHSALITRSELLRARHAHSPLAGAFTLFGAHSLEQEAQAVDIKVRQLLLSGKTRIAVVVQDRMVARRARALLERAEVLVEDETGWTFSTIAASTAVMRWLEVLSSRFYYQELLDFLKSPFVFADWPATRRKQAVYELERLVRKHGVVSHLGHYIKLVRGEAEGADALELLLRLEQARAVVGRSARSLQAWLGALLESLQLLGVMQALQGDAAGQQLQQLLSRLRLELEHDQGKFSFGEWQRWLNQQLEGATFRDVGIKSPVVFTHLAATRLRCFDAAILVGCDAAHLPAPGRAGAFFNQSVRQQLGLPTVASELRLLQEDLVALVRNCAAIFVTWQAAKNAEPNLLSPYFERLETVHAIAWGCGLRDEEMAQLLPLAQVCAPDQAANEACPVGGSANPRPALPQALVPQSITASGYNSLLACPYQFYARHALRLNELDEVQLELEKQDYGTYVHDILSRFHTRYPALAGHSRASLEQALNEITQQVFAQAIQANYLSHAWAQRWTSLVPSYLDWQLERERQGWHWLEGEVARQLQIGLDDERRLILKGRLDRVDAREHEGGRQLAVLDYKTQSKAKLKAKLAVPGEDVQLPVYALLLDEAVAEAAFVCLDRDKTEAVEFSDDLGALSQQVLQRLRELFGEMHRGASLPAQGADEVCGYCEMRGLCRKDYWQA
jgi:ATP-dependent helicase/nuclease subunit B